MPLRHFLFSLLFIEDRREYRCHLRKNASEEWTKNNRRMLEEMLEEWCGYNRC